MGVCVWHHDIRIPLSGMRSWTFVWASRSHGAPVLIYCNSWKINVLLLNSWDSFGPATTQRKPVSAQRRRSRNEKFFDGFPSLHCTRLFHFWLLPAVYSKSYLFIRSLWQCTKFFARRLHDLFTLHSFFGSSPPSSTLAFNVWSIFLRSNVAPILITRPCKIRNALKCLCGVSGWENGI